MSVACFWNNEKVGDNEMGLEVLFDRIRMSRINTNKLIITASKGSKGIYGNKCQ